MEELFFLQYSLLLQQQLNMNLNELKRKLYAYGSGNIHFFV